MDRNSRQNNLANNSHRSMSHMNGINGKNRNHVNINIRLSLPSHNHNSSHTHMEPSHHTQHEDLIFYIHESWDKVNRELEKGNNPDIKWYKTPRQAPANFRPFDLKALCERRTYIINNKRQYHS